MLKRIGVVLGILVAASAVWAESAQLDWVERIYGDGRHNAFTDLVQWNGAYYVCFRHAESHMSLDGQIRVIRSADLHTWEPCGTIDTAGDDRDPHLTPAGDRLYVFFGTWDIVHQPGNKLPDRGSVRSYCASTTDGSTWSKVSATYEPGWWLWRVSRHNGDRQDGGFYSAAYTAVRPTPAARETRLLQSADGTNWSLVSTVTRERSAGEADMYFEPDGSIWLISRTGDQSGSAMFSRSDPARTNWTADDLGVLVHSPVIARWKDRFFVAGRGRDRGRDGETYVTRIWEILNAQGNPQNVELREIITLPSDGDNAYPGLLVDPASIESESPAFFVTWYSQHEREQVGGGKNAACIYAARVSVSPAP